MSDQQDVSLSTAAEANNFTNRFYTRFQLEPNIPNKPQHILYNCYTALKVYRVKVLPVANLGRQ